VAKTKARTPTFPVPDALPDSALEPAQAPEAGATHDGLLFADDLSGLDARDARFLGCALGPARADGLALVGARVVDCRVHGLGATEAPWRASTWRDTTVTDGRVGALDLSAARWDRVAVVGGRYDFVNLREAELTDVTFRDVDLREVDLTGARVTRVRFEDCRIGHLDVTAATLDGLDVSPSELQEISGVGNLRGTTVSELQLLHLAPLLAAHLGVTVR